MSDFKREGRYWVFKRKYLSNADDSEFDCKTHRLMAANKEAIPECVVVESDWPIYEEVWAMVEAVSTGKPTKIQSLEAKLAGYILSYKASVEDVHHLEEANKELKELIESERQVSERIRLKNAELRKDNENLDFKVDTLRKYAQQSDKRLEEVLSENAELRREVERLRDNLRMLSPLKEDYLKKLKGE